MPRSASPYLSRLSNILNRKLQNILRTERDRVRALKKATAVFQDHFRLLMQYSQRKVLPNGKKLTPQETGDVMNIWVAQALSDFEKILDDRDKPV